MDETNAAIEKLLRIQQLWNELERMKPDAPEYEPAVEKMRVLVAEYRALTEVYKNLKESK